MTNETLEIIIACSMIVAIVVTYITMIFKYVFSNITDNEERILTTFITGAAVFVFTLFWPITIVTLITAAIAFKLRKIRLNRIKSKTLNKE